MADEEIEFNTDILDLNDRTNIDLSQFARAGFILPGTYTMLVNINTQALSDHPVVFYPAENDPKDSQACVSPKVVEQLGLKKEYDTELSWWKEGQCLDLGSLPGMEAKGDLSTSQLNISLPQVYLEYTAPNWDPPSRWDDGVSGLLVDYNVNAQSDYQKGKGNSNNFSGNGTIGANAGPWRLRADWQARIDDAGQTSQQRLEWSRYYAYRAIPELQARLTLGEDYLESKLFDSFRFAGVSLKSDDNQLPPNLRGYAPEVIGVAKTNARVTISQKGRVLYETLVAAGPFRIQDLNDAVSGALDVRVEEQDGSVNTFQVQSASIPYLTRPGTVRYKLATGRPSDLRNNVEGEVFATAEFSWGISNGWSLYGGGIGDSNYRALSVGVGRDLLAFGAVSFDITQSHATLRDEVLSGRSYGLSYSKEFEQYDSQVTFAGYRFSEMNYLTMTEYLDARDYTEYGEPIGRNRELYTVTFNKQFRDAGLSVYMNYTNQSYWDRPDTQRLNLSASRYFTLGNVKNVSLSLNLFRNKDRARQDDGMYLSVSFPLGKSGTMSTSVNKAQNDTSFSTRYSDNIDERNSYQLSAGNDSASAYLSHTGDRADIDVGLSSQEGDYNSLRLSARGGGTLTPHGGALHRTSAMGGARLMVDTGGVADVPVRGFGTPTRTNTFGKAVIADVSSYRRTSASVDLESLPDNVEAMQSVIQLTLTEGAIGYRTLEVISGQKAMAVIRLPNGSTPPFGATVKNEAQQNTGIVNDGGDVYLSGIQAGEQMFVSWGGSEQCTLTLPINLPADGLTDTLQLLCQMGGAKTPLTGKHTNMENKS